MLSERHQKCSSKEIRAWLGKQAQNNSKTIEKQIEHLFLAEVLQECWFHYQEALDVSHAEVDAFAYDLVLRRPGHQPRYVQLKARLSTGGGVHVNPDIETLPGGCVIWMKYEITDECRIKLTYYFWDLRLKPLPKPNAGGKHPGKSTLKPSDFPSKRIEAGELVDLLLFEGGA